MNSSPIPAVIFALRTWFVGLRLYAIVLLGVLGLSILLPRISYAVFQPRFSQQQNELSSFEAKRARQESVPGEILVRFREGSPAARATGKGGGAYTGSFVAKSGRQIPIQVEGLGGDREIVEGLRLARVAPGDTASAIETLLNRPDVLYAEPNFIRRKDAVPNDPRYPSMWNLKNVGGSFAVAGADIRAEQAWDVSTGSRNTVVAVIDQGIDINHEDLQANIWRNPGEIPGNGIDDDGNGFVDDINGYDFVHNDGTVYDGPGTNPDGLPIDRHGTHVAGIIGAVGNNGIGVVGVNWQASMMSLKILGPEGGTSVDVVRALSYTKMMRDRWVSSGGAQGANIRITNNSYGGRDYSQAEADAIQAVGTSGILFVASAGNLAEDNYLLPKYPASYDLPNVISVAATDQSDKLSNSSNFGSRSVHLGAPGASILSTTPGDSYSPLSGTSMASPHVAGVAALIWEQHPNFSVERVRASILFGGAPIPALRGKTITGNRLDAAGSLQNAAETDVTPPATITDLHIVSIDGRTVTLAWTAPGDDGGSGHAELVETRFTDQLTGKQFIVGVSTSAPGGAPQLGSLNLPYQHAAGTLGLRVFDNAGNTSLASIPVAVDPVSVNPYEITEGPAEPLSTGGTPLRQNVDDNISDYTLPFTFPFFGHHVPSVFLHGRTSSVEFSTNGVLYIPKVTTPWNDAISAADRLAGWKMIAGLWDDLDLSTSRRADADIYVVKPDSSRVIFRWQGVLCNASETTGQCTGGDPVNFEIEIKIDGTIITRYGAGNTNLKPVVGISGGDLDPFVIASHTSEVNPISLTNAPTITYRPRTTPRSAEVSATPTVRPGAVLLGHNGTLTINAHNGGPNAAAGVRLEGFLPPELSYVSCTTPQGACWGIPGVSGTRVTAELGSIEANGSVLVRVVFNATRSPARGPSFPYETTWTIISSAIDPVWPATFSFSGINPNPTPLTGATAIGAGSEHSLAIVPGGNVIGWGSNRHSQLGDSTLLNINRPVFITGIANAVAVDGGGAHSLALRSDGTVWAWGANFGGALGDGTTTNRKTPAPVNGLTNIAAISAGGSYNVVLRDDGTVWTWGLNRYGQLGDGSTTDRLTPVQVPGLTAITAISAGSEHTAAVKNDGTLWMWGRNANGQLGDGTQINRSSPVQVNGLTGVVLASAGFGHTLALRNDGTMWAWGANSYGQLGDGTLSSKSSPVQITGFGDVATIAVGRDHSVALRGDGTVWNWGSNSSGKMGQYDLVNDQLRPIQTLWLSGITAIAAGEEFSLALKPGGKVSAWGDGQWGQLGNGFGVDRSYAYDVSAAPNLIDDAAFFVRRHYLDFFNREPDAAGNQFWTRQITDCMSNQACIDIKRVNVSAAFYLSIEFQQTGYLVERIYKTAYGDATGSSTLGGAHQLAVPIVRFSEFLPDTQTIGQGVIVNQPGWETALENNKVAFTNAFVHRSRFTAAYPNRLTPEQYVDMLNTNSGSPLSPSERNQVVTDLASGLKTRAQVLRAVAEDPDLINAEFNRAFVLMQYFGYLRRNPNEASDSDYTGYDFWLGKLNQFNGNFVNAEMVKAFILSGEYRQRFGP